MKEWALKHPWMTFFLLDSAITAAAKIVAGVINCFSGATEVTVEPEVNVEVEAE